MINIHIKEKNDAINYIKIKGHANYADAGYDIVCASVSTICVTTINAIIRYNEGALVYTEDDGSLEIGILMHDKIIDILVDNMVDLFINLSEQYKDNVKIIK